MILFIIIFCFLSVRILILRNSSRHKLFETISDYFHYGVFIKFWIQTSLDFLITSTYALFHGYFQSIFYIVDYCISIIILVISTQIIQFVMWVISMKLIALRKKISSDDEIETFNKKFGSLFDEFAQNRFDNFYFYQIFFFRRALIVTIIFLVSQPVVRLTLSFTLSLVVTII